jgi:hypothetical protein
MSKLKRKWLAIMEAEEGGRSGREGFAPGDGETAEERPEHEREPTERTGGGMGGEIDGDEVKVALPCAAVANMGFDVDPALELAPLRDEGVEGPANAERLSTTD